MFQNVYAAVDNSAAQQANNFSMLFLMGGFLLIFYFLIIRPKQQKEKEQTNLLSKLDKNDEVITYSGLMGKIIRIKDDFIVLSIADNVEIKMQRSYIKSILPKGTLKNI